MAKRAGQTRNLGKNVLEGARPRAVLAMLCLLVLAGCASPGKTASPSLAERLRSLSPAVAPGDAILAADTAQSYSLALAKEYRVVRPAIFHNILVNLGVRQRGLCYQWADDLTARLESLHLQTLQLHRGVARLETRREHSSVVLTAPGQPFDQGIVLDAWRHSGRLYWGNVRADKYPWIEVEVIPEGENERTRLDSGENAIKMRKLPNSQFRATGFEVSLGVSSKLNPLSVFVAFTT